jgi:threonine dehydrogenase-like Zn-dependent dehydrogenase
MQALRFDGESLQWIADHAEPRPLVGEVSVRVLRAGICETDLQILRGYMGFQGILGHEFVGVAEDGPLAGERVVGEINCGCGRCATCLSGRTTHCPHRTVLGILGRDGAFAERLSLPHGNLHRLPDSVPTEWGVFVEPLAAACRIVEQVPSIRNATVVVLGDGRLGNLCAQVLKRHGGRVLVLGRHEAKLSRLARLGIETDLASAPKPDHSADLVVDCTGSASGLVAALAWVRPRGTVVLKTTIAGPHEQSLAAIVIDEVTLLGSRCGPFPPAIELLASRGVEVESLLDATWPLAEGLAAIEAARAPGAMKVLLRMEPQLAGG